MARLTRWFCRHAWSFPRRQTEFNGHEKVDVQTCLKCGARRIALVQFGPAPEAQA